jgi:hypothetical protein
MTLVLKGDFDAAPVHITTARPPLSFVQGTRPSLNRRGQIAFSVRRAGGRPIIVLMTPQAP